MTEEFIATANRSNKVFEGFAKRGKSSTGGSMD
jgi:hypothetical protein